MFIEERHNEIIEHLTKNGKITILEITDKYGISDESARRDLRILEQKGICKRTHGGAIVPVQIGFRPPANRDFDSMTVFDNYKEIAKIAVSKIKENDVVYLPSGSFGAIMISLLPRDISYTLVINSVDIGKSLRDFDNINTYVVGGKMRQSGSLVDSLATEFVSRLHFDLCFMTGSGLTANFGLTNGTDETASFQRTIINNSRKKILIIPSNKIGINSFVKVCDITCFDEIITDWDCIDKEKTAIVDTGVILTIAEEQK
ncbi:MAG: DeoR/GlpR transcriptional regulator [Clostridia bacterium]|nr:DeoR/GlpR transcriptional regulator [Clostridia bacterium]